MSRAQGPVGRCADGVRR